MTSVRTSAAGTADYTGTWTLDVPATSIEFHTKTMWVVDVKGTLRALNGNGTVGADGSVHGKLVIDATSIDTKVKRRDAHLRTAGFLETAIYPTIDFEVTSGRLLESGRAELGGLLTIHGQTRPVVVVGDVESDENSLTLTVEVDDLDRKDWSVSKAAIGPSAHNRIIIRAPFTKC